MPFEITTTVECYLLPDDGAAAQALFLQHLRDPYEMWIIAYSFTLEPMIDEIIANNTPAAPIHIYLDYSESTGPAEAPGVRKLIAAGVEVTIGTSTAGPQYICHTKGIVCDDEPQPWCWEGSTNFSLSAWKQVNTALFFHSPAYRDAFVNQFLHLRYFAWTQERDKQLMTSPPVGALTPPPDVPVGTVPPGKSPSKKKSPGKKSSGKKSAGKKKSPGKKAAGKNDASRKKAHQPHVTGA
jgi:hypothetical protein